MCGEVSAMATGTLTSLKTDFRESHAQKKACVAVADESALVFALPPGWAVT
jgi:hypothetical protein